MSLKIDELVSVGRVTPLSEPGDWLRWSPKPGASKTLPDIDDVFLVFSQRIVWFVTIAEFKTLKGRVLVRFHEPEVCARVREFGLADVRISPEDTTEPGEPAPNLEGSVVVLDGEKVGIVTDWFHNNAQWVLVCETDHGIEFMVPFVDEFIRSSTNNRVELINARELLPE